MLTTRVLALIAAFGIAGPGPAWATVATLLDEPALTREAQSIVRGRVVAQSVVMVDGRLWTDSVLEVLELWKGRVAVGGRMLVRQPGGEKGKLGMHVAGAARFLVGEEVVLFTRWVSGRHVPLGMGQGKFTVYRDAAGRARAQRDLSGFSLVAPDARGKLQIGLRSTAVTDRGLDELRATVRKGGRP